jgi:hypothetical protein
MNQDNQSTLNKWKRAVKCCNESPNETALNLAFKADKEALENLLPKITELSKVLDIENDHAENKKNIKAMLIEACLDVCVNLSGYAVLTNDAALTKLSEQTKSSLSKGKEADVLQRCQDIADKAREIFPDLAAKRGMPEVFLTTLEDLVKQYEAAIPEPKDAQKEKSNALTELDKLFAEGEGLFKLLVGSSINLKPVAADFLGRFNKAATHIALPSSPTKINFLVTNAVTKEKISDFLQTSEALGMSKVLNTSDSPTVCSPNKNADFIIEREGFEPAILTNLYVKKGQINTFRVKLTPIKPA